MEAPGTEILSLCGSSVSFRLNARVYSIEFTADHVARYCRVQSCDLDESARLPGTILLGIDAHQNSTQFNTSDDAACSSNDRQPNRIGIGIGDFDSNGEFDGLVRYFSTVTEVNHPNRTCFYLRTLGHTLYEHGTISKAHQLDQSTYYSLDFGSLPTVCIPKAVVKNKAHGAQGTAILPRSCSYQPLNTALTFVVPRYHEEIARTVMCPVLVHALDPCAPRRPEERLSQLL